MNNWLAVFVGGGLGSICRMAISLWLGKTVTGFPFATLLANVLSCIVLAIAATYLAPNLQISQPIKSFVLIGFCGGFSTFSTFSREVFLLIQNQQWLLAILYIAISLLSCILLLWFIEK